MIIIGPMCLAVRKCPVLKKCLAMKKPMAALCGARVFTGRNT